jgi:hypothetical protein
MKRYPIKTILNAAQPADASYAFGERSGHYEVMPTRTSSLINKKHVKEFALACGQQRAWKPTRVSKEFLEQTEARLRNMIANHISNHPSVGTTIR